MEVEPLGSPAVCALEARPDAAPICPWHEVPFLGLFKSQKPHFSRGPKILHFLHLFPLKKHKKYP